MYLTNTRLVLPWNLHNNQTNSTLSSYQVPEPISFLPYQLVSVGTESFCLNDGGDCHGGLHSCSCSLLNLLPPLHQIFKGQHLPCNNVENPFCWIKQQTFENMTFAISFISSSTLRKCQDPETLNHFSILDLYNVKTTQAIKCHQGRLKPFYKGAFVSTCDLII